ncbi:aminotransferase class III-fold pyridoxal phosphate-dependent enzyme [Nocardia rhizosphaerihabitans]|nr:aminotransferase class III-fold pyridoxal phosphate-dependent enzyme [Nocardia rhizosphaerihabitans]
MAAAVTESAILDHGTGGEEIAAVLRTVDDDTDAYWNSALSTNDWKSSTPTQVAVRAGHVAALSGRAFSSNPADTRASWALAVGAAAAAQAVAESNAPAHPTRAALMAGTVDEIPDPVMVIDAHGSRVRTADGRVLLDVSSGLYNTPLGHRHPAPAIAMLAQASSVAAINPFNSVTAIADRVAERLLQLFDSPGGRVVFASSGSEAVETALRFALSVAGPTLHARPRTFHGITAGAAGLSTYASIRGPLPRMVQIHHHAISEWNAPGVGVVEPAGIASGRPPLSATEREHLQHFRSRGGVVVVDEVLSGLGRTLWPGLTPALGIPADIVVVGKGLANGIAPVSAVLLTAEMIGRIRASGPLDHGHTHTNHPTSLGAALGCLDALDGLDHDPTKLADAARDSGLEVTSLGWLATIAVPATPRDQLVRSLSRAGVLLHLPSMVSSVDRLVVAPPLTTEADDLAEMMRCLANVVEGLRG